METTIEKAIDRLDGKISAEILQIRTEMEANFTAMMDFLNKKFSDLSKELVRSSGHNQADLKLQSSVSSDGTSLCDDFDGLEGSDNDCCGKLDQPTKTQKLESELEDESVSEFDFVVVDVDPRPDCLNLKKLQHHEKESSDLEILVGNGDAELAGRPAVLDHDFENSSGETCSIPVAKPNRSGAFKFKRSNIYSFNEILNLYQDPQFMPPAAVSVSASPALSSSMVSVDADKKDSSSPSVSPSSVVSSNSLSNLPVSSTSEILKTEAQPHVELLQPKKDVGSMTQVPSLPHELPAVELSLKSKLAVSSAQVSETPTGVSSGSQTSITDIARPASNLVSNVQPLQPSTGNSRFSAPQSTSIITTNGKTGSLDVIAAQEDEMEEEAPETNQMTELGLGSLSSFGISSSPNPSAPKSNPFGAPFGIVATSPATTTFTAPIPTGELFRPASFSFQSPQPSQPYQPAGFGAFSGGFASSTPGQAPAQSAFGQPAQLGAGQQALGSVLGSFGQSRQIGTGLPGSGFASCCSFGGGFASPESAAGFSNAATGGGFASISSTSGGFAGLGSGGGFGAMASGGGGFGALSASASGGFAGVGSGGGAGGFAAAASGGGGFAGAGSGGGFGAFGNQQQPGGFSAFGGGGGQTLKPPELFTRMRK